MSRRNNAVRGPTSAMTEFLRSINVTPTSIALRAANANQQQNEEQNGQDATDPEAGPSNQAQEEQPEAGPSRPSRRRGRQASGYASDELDEPESPPKKRKLTKAQEAKAKAKAKKANDEGDDEDEEDAYTALSKSMWSNAPSKPPVGSFSKCAKCEEEFTVTKYTMAANPGPGWLCHSCAKASGADPFKKPAVPKKRKAAGEKRTVTHFEERRLPSLVSLCIQVISKHIDDVEALGDIGTANLREIAKTIAKSRSLTTENVKLFYNANQPTLALFDATNLPPPSYETLAMLNPSLTSLRLDFCGRMDSFALDSLSNQLPNLTDLELLGPFLVKAPSWQNFLRDRKLRSFKITQSPRFDIECLRALIESSGETLEELKLCEIGKIDDAFLDEMKRFGKQVEPETKPAPKKGKGRTSRAKAKAVPAVEPANGFEKLKYLDISFPAASCSAETLIGLLQSLGEILTHLNLSGHDSIDDSVFAEGIQKYCTHLETLVVTHCPDLTDSGVASFFSEWESTSLTTINLSRNPLLASEALLALLSHSGSTLEELNINGWKDTSNEALMQMAKQARELRKVDLGWCRETDDFVLKELIAGNESEHRSGLKFLQNIWVWGCGRVDGAYPRKKGIFVHGVEGHAVS